MEGLPATLSIEELIGMSNHESGFAVSVAMTTYNGEQFVREQLESIIKQTHQPLELVLCDDGSTDRTCEIAFSYLDRARFPIRVYRGSVNQGSTKTFERAIKLCKGDVIALADQDDVWRPHKLQEISKVFLNNHGCVGAFSDAFLVDGEGAYLGKSLWESVGLSGRIRRRLENGGLPAFRTLLKRNCVTGTTFAFRSRFRDSFLPIPESWVHDAWIALHLSLVGGICPLPDKLVAYRQHPSNQIGVRKRMLRDRIANRVALHGAKVQMEDMEKLWARRGAGSQVRPEYLREIQAKIAHLETRLGAVDHLYPLLRELFHGRYTRYSNGMPSFLKDLHQRTKRDSARLTG